MRANIHTYGQFIKDPAGHSLESLLLTVLFNLDDFDFPQKCENDQFVLLIVCHEHRLGLLDLLSNLFPGRFFRILVRFGDVALHDLADVHFDGLVGL